MQSEKEPGEGEQAAGDFLSYLTAASLQNAAYFDCKDESGFPKFASSLLSLWFLEEIRILWAEVIFVILTNHFHVTFFHGIPLQLDRVFAIFLPGHISRKKVQGHFEIWSLFN